MDRLFDRGLITFTADGTIVVSARLPDVDARAVGLDPAGNVGPFNPDQAGYLAYHREHVFQGR